jgi:plasmid stabilization system protein ParE
MKKYNVSLMPDAIDDLENIYNFIAEQSGFPKRAWLYMEKLHRKCQELETSPERGQQRDDLMEGLRIYPLDKKSVAAFIIDHKNSAVIILNVFYGGRDYEVIFPT